MPSVKYVPNSRFLSLSMNEVAYPSTNATISETITLSAVSIVFISSAPLSFSSMPFSYITLFTANISATVSDTVIKYIR